MLLKVFMFFYKMYCKRLLKKMGVKSVDSVMAFKINMIDGTQQDAVVTTGIGTGYFDNVNVTLAFRDNPDKIKKLL